MPAQLTELGRRVLGHLPVWAEDEDAHVKMEGGPEVSIRSYPLEDLTGRLAEDPCIDPPLSQDDVASALAGLSGEKLAKSTADGWRMTKQGFEAITGPQEKPGQVPGAVVVETHPAVVEANAKG